MPSYRNPFTGETFERFSQSEREAIERKAIEQAIQAAELANATPEVFFPAAEWPFRLSEQDRVFLKVQRISTL